MTSDAPNPAPSGPIADQPAGGPAPARRKRPFGCWGCLTAWVVVMVVFRVLRWVLVYLGVAFPTGMLDVTSIQPGHRESLEEVVALDAGERLLFAYSDNAFTATGGGYLLTDRRLAVWASSGLSGRAELLEIPLAEVTAVSLAPGDSSRRPDTLELTAPGTSLRLELQGHYDDRRALLDALEQHTGLVVGGR